jgi:phenylacetate-CoA ligase
MEGYRLALPEGKRAGLTMSLDFTIKDFFYPCAIARTHVFLRKSQWWPQEKLRAYQCQRLTRLIAHAYRNVPYYTALFDKIKLRPRDIRSPEDLKKIPPINKEGIKKNFAFLRAKNAARFSPKLFKTHGTTGASMEFYLDKNVLIAEFCRYWRQWGWAGYRLGMRVCDFSSQYFLDTDTVTKKIFSFQRTSNRLILNPFLLSQENLSSIVRAIMRYRPLFLKGTPSVLCVLCMFLKKAKITDITFKAIFTTGEIVLPPQRKLIEETLCGPLFDSYGHMESTVSMGQCAQRNYHINVEYGILESENASGASAARGVFYGTSLHNYAMPFIRYEIEDQIDALPEEKKCPCGRTLPIVQGVRGRSQDVVITPDKRFVGNLFVIFNLVEGVEWFQILQETLTHITVVLVATAAFDVLQKETLLRYLKTALGDIEIEFVFLTLEELCASPYLKYRPIVTKLKMEDYVS